MNAQRANCEAVIEAENKILALVAQPARLKELGYTDLGTAVDAQMLIIRTKALPSMALR